MLHSIINSKISYSVQSFSCFSEGKSEHNRMHDILNNNKQLRDFFLFHCNNIPLQRARSVKQMVSPVCCGITDLSSIKHLWNW